MSERLRSGLLGLALLVTSAWSAACGGYATRLEDVRRLVDKGAVEQAVEELDLFIVEGQGGASPQKEDLPLLLLERGALRQSLGDHSGAVADFTDADPMLEVLEFTPDRTEALAEYLWSGSSTLYRAPLHEKMMVNISAAASFLAAEQWSSARVEARRIGVLLDYFDGTERREHGMLGAAAWVAGLSMEMAGDAAAAVRFYLRASEFGDAPGLDAAIVRLAHGTPLARNERVEAARQRLGLDEGELPDVPDRELVVLVFAGRAPFRIAEHVPVGLAIAWYRTNTAYALTQEQSVAMNRAVAGDLLTWVNLPVLFAPKNRLRRFDVLASGRSLGAAEVVADVGSFVLAQWEVDRAAIAFAGLTRMLTRVVARELVHGTGRALDSGNGVGSAVGFLAGLVTQGAMQAADVPDTRSWTFMPASLHVARLPLPEGSTEVRVRGSGMGPSEEILVPIESSGARRVVTTVRFLE